jgi:2-methylcitrate dehydratase
LSKGSSVIGLRKLTTPDLATFVNGILVRYLDYNDTYLSKEPAHPSDNIPAALAVGEAQGVSPRDFITAVATGYEVQCRLADAASLRAHGWDHVTYGAFSTACLAGYLLKLDETRIRHAIALAGVANVALRQTRAGELSMWKAAAFANAARNGVFAAYLAKEGMTGPSDIFEGQFGFRKLVSGELDLGAFAGDDGAPYIIGQTYIKFYPAEYHSQTAIAAALELRKQLGSTDQVEAIDIRSFDAAVDIIAGDPERWHPKTRETADHSLPYCVAVAFSDGDVTLDSFSDKRLSDRALLGLVRKVRVERDAELTARYPEANPNEITVRLKSGKTLRQRVDYARGHPKNKMSDEEVADKFRRLALPVLGSDRKTETFLERLWNLDKISTIGELTSSLREI